MWGVYYDGYSVNTVKINSSNYNNNVSHWFIGEENIEQLPTDTIPGVIRNGRGLYFYGLPVNKPVIFQVSKAGDEWHNFANFNTSNSKPTPINNPFITLGGWWSCTRGTGNCSGVVYAKQGTQSDYLYRAI